MSDRQACPAKESMNGGRFADLQADMMKLTMPKFDVEEGVRGPIGWTVAELSGTVRSCMSNCSRIEWKSDPSKYDQESWKR